MKLRNVCMAAVATLAAASSAMAAGPTKTDFSNGLDGWYGDSAAGNAFNGIDHSMADGSLGFHTQGLGYGYVLKNDTAMGFLGDYTGMKGFSFSLDIRVHEMNGGGNSEYPVAQQDLVLELRDYDKPGTVMDYSAIWIRLGSIGAAMPGSQHFSVTIDDTSSHVLPAGWGGTGAQDGWSPALPPGMTLNRLLRDVDQVVVSTFTPGWLVGVETYYDVTIDNIAISAVPEPGQWGMMAAGLGLLGLTARRRNKVEALRGKAPGAVPLASDA